MGALTDVIVFCAHPTRLVHVAFGVLKLGKSFNPELQNA